jgi:hypothetical protein
MNDDCATGAFFGSDPRWRARVAFLSRWQTQRLPSVVIVRHLGHCSCSCVGHHHHRSQRHRRPGLLLEGVDVSRLGGEVE